MRFFRFSLRRPLRWHRRGWADNNKPGRSAFTRVGDLSSIDYFITNRPLFEEWAARFAAKGTTVVIGDKEENAPADLPD